jgi:hypothetical protein
VIMFGKKEESHKIADFLDPKGSRQKLWEILVS